MKKAILSVFDYSAVPQFSHLPSAERDLSLAFKIAKEILKIDDITVITDIDVTSGYNIIKLDYPDKTAVVRELKRIVKNTSKPTDVFVYFSCHGVKNALCFSNELFSSKEFFDIFFNNGLPIGSTMLVVFDTCHSGSMSDFHFRYDPFTRTMEKTKELPTGIYYPLSVSLSASDDDRKAISTHKGSPFTYTLYRLLNELDCGITIEQLHDRLYEMLPTVARIMNPTICSTSSRERAKIPFFHNLDNC
ncbi:MAG: hypothetical protein KatS3mg101_0808 [Patescibacteria group bacterium]|nr:MAG: hypothetical protein KatS3mg101_0808 [Patescibacteria group bacterium]